MRQSIKESFVDDSKSSSVYKMTISQGAYVQKSNCLT